MITLTFTPDELRVIDQALGLVAYRDAAPVVASINEQIRALCAELSQGTDDPIEAIYRKSLTVR